MITLSTEGRRTYITGNTYPIRDRIRAIGAHWDAERKAWWTAKRDEAEKLIAKLGQPPQAESKATQPQREAPGERATVAGRAEYKGKTYYIAGRVERGRTSYDDRVQAVTSRDGATILLYSRDGSLQFWADRSAVRVQKTYDRPQSIRGLKKFAEELRANGGNAELVAARRHGWDGRIGSPSYYSSGAFDELDM